MPIALITGASSGIGLELARIFAQNKTDLVVVARNELQLQELSRQLESEFGVKVWILAKDLSVRESAQQIFDWCQEQKLEIQYLINNAGFGDNAFFATSDIRKQEQMIDVNIWSLTALCHLFLPGMLQSKTGKILNVASTAAFVPGPEMAVYYATKAYVLHFSEAIANELQHTGITVTALCPGPTSSGFQAAAQMENNKLVKGKKLPSSKSVAAYGYKAMMRGKTVAIPGFGNFMTAFGVRFVSRNFATRISRWVQEH